MATLSIEAQMNPTLTAVRAEFRAAVQDQLNKVLDEVMVQFETHIGVERCDALRLAPAGLVASYGSIFVRFSLVV